MKLINKKNKYPKFMLKICLVIFVAYIIPKITVFYLICGIIDFSRNKQFNIEVINRYFFGNGLLTWALSPFNLLIDLITAENKGIYKLKDLPKPCQDEINFLLKTFDKQNIIEKLKDKVGPKKRGMIFSKWYGKNNDNFINIKEFAKDFEYIKTIGVSIFNQQQSTSTHFGPLRVTIRVLYNFTPIENDNVFIMVNDHKHIWHENPFFIFDDTLMHKSVNHSDQVRYCMFVDVLRPCAYPKLMNLIITILRFMLSRINGIFYKNWDFI